MYFSCYSCDLEHSKQYLKHKAGHKFCQTFQSYEAPKNVTMQLNVQLFILDFAVKSHKSDYICKSSIHSHIA